MKISSDFFNRQRTSEKEISNWLKDAYETDDEDTEQESDERTDDRG